MAGIDNLKPCKPGETHNPKGRPKGAKSFSTRVKQLLAGMSDDKDWTSPLAAEKIKLIFQKDKKGKYLYSAEIRNKAANDILDRIEGKPLQKQEIEANVEIPQAQFIVNGKIEDDKDD